MRFVRGSVLDVGWGGGRACLHLQARGLDVVGIDSSPGAIACCRARGVLDARQVSIERLDPSLGTFDTVLMLGQNFGLLGSRTKARLILRRLAALTTPRGRIVAESHDPHAHGERVHRRYRRRNVARGRMPGQMRFRVRYGELSTPWRDWLQVSRDELVELLAGTQWRVSRTLGDGASYVAVIDKVRLAGAGRDPVRDR